MLSSAGEGVINETTREGALLRVGLEADDGAAVMRLEGQLDLSTVTLVDSEIGRLDGLQHRLVLLDLHGLEFLDCSGVRPLTRLGVELSAHGGRLVVSGATRLVAYVLTAAGLGESLAP